MQRINSVSFSNKKIFGILILIALLSLGLKLIVFDTTLLPSEDTFQYTLNSISHVNGIFTEPERKTLGWSLFASPIIFLVDSNNFLDYVNVLRILSLSVSLFTIYPMYLLARKFFNINYSLIGSLLFALIPVLNYNSAQGLSEPLYILILILAVNFIFSQNDKLIYLAFIFSGLAWLVRWPGILVFIIISIIYFLLYKKSSKNIIRFVLCMIVFSLVVSPMLINRYLEYDDPLYFTLTPQLFTGDYSRLLAENTRSIEFSAFDYIDEYGIFSFLKKFIGEGISNILISFLRMSFPFLIILFPIGAFFSIRPFDQNIKFVKSIWIIIFLLSSSMIIVFAVVSEKRLLYPILPFVVIISIIPIQRLIEYGLSTFSFTPKMKNLSLIILIFLIITLSLFAILRYDLPDHIENDEKIKFGNYLSKNLNGKIVDAGNSLQGLIYSQISSPPGNFKSYDEDFGLDSLRVPPQLKQTDIHGKTLDDFIINAEIYNVKYLVINEKGVTEQWYPFLSDVYSNEANFSYLKKIFDSKEQGYKKFNVKLFEIDYEEFKKFTPT